MRLSTNEPVAKADRPKFSRRGPSPREKQTAARGEHNESAVETSSSAPGREQVASLIWQCLRPHWRGALACVTVCARLDLGASAAAGSFAP